jgi:hypothetical protein
MMKKKQPQDTLEDQVAAARAWATKPLQEVPASAIRILDRAAKPGEYNRSYTSLRILAEALDRIDAANG